VSRFLNFDEAPALSKDCVVGVVREGGGGGEGKGGRGGELK